MIGISVDRISTHRTRFRQVRDTHTLFKREMIASNAFHVVWRVSENGGRWVRKLVRLAPFFGFMCLANRYEFWIGMGPYSIHALRGLATTYDTNHRPLQNTNHRPVQD
jgi:hypothetical protein